MQELFWTFFNILVFRSCGKLPCYFPEHRGFKNRTLGVTKPEQFPLDPACWLCYNYEIGIGVVHSKEGLKDV